MKKKNNAICSICGKSYHVCSSCKDVIKESPWKLHTDTPEHYKIYQVIHGLSTGVYTKEEAKLKFKNIDLSDLESFRENIKNIIEDVIGEDDKKSEIEEIIELPVETEVVKSIIKDSLVVEESDDLKIIKKKKSSKVVEADEYTVPTE